MNTDAICPVCGCDFERHHAVVTCEECLTPHHSDCWSYNQGCAIYGCAPNRQLSSVATRPDSDFPKKRRKRERNAAVLTGPVSSFCRPSYGMCNSAIKCFQRVVVSLQEMAYGYTARTVLGFPLIVISSLFLARRCSDVVLLISVPMLPTLFTACLFIVLALIDFVLHKYFRFLDGLLTDNL